MRHLLLVLFLSAGTPTDIGGAPADGLGLAPGPAPAAVGSGLPAAPIAPFGPLGFGFGGLALAAGGLAATVRTRGGGSRVRRTAPAGTSQTAAPPPDMLLVFISGHGSNFTGNFEELQRLIGATPEQVRSFDYRWLIPGHSHRSASQLLRLEEVADGLQAFVAGLAAEGRPIYLVGHSKGGAAIAEMLARWDEHPGLVVPNVVGASLLDPPIASGIHGELQEIGWLVPSLADNGGYDPIECEWWLRCRDTREHLGRAAGVEVLVIRNPDALATNFHDEPEGLRVLDLVDDGDGHALGRIWTRGSVIGRIGDAHSVVLTHPAVASCIREETIALGSCDWQGDQARKVLKLRPWGRGRSYGPVLR